MDNLTYRAYISDPTLREQVEREVRRARAEAVREYIVAPLQRLFRRTFAGASRNAPRVLDSRTA